MAEHHHASVRELLATRRSRPGRDGAGHSGAGSDESSSPYEVMGLEAPGWREQLGWKVAEIGPLRLGAAVVLMVVALGLFLVVGDGGGTPIEDDLPLAAPLASEAPVSGTVQVSTTLATTVLVHAAGEVVSPGIYELDAGARVADLIELAGGPTAAAELNRVNLAEPLTDGSQVYVPAVGEPAPAGAVPSSKGGQPDPGAPVDLNTADAALLETLPGVGPATAAAIIDYRERAGPYASVEQLLDVPGIGEAKLAALYDLVRAG